MLLERLVDGVDIAGQVEGEGGAPDHVGGGQL